MRKLRNLNEDRLKAAFEDASQAKHVKRLAMALAYVDGVSVDTLSDRYGIPRSTIYAWLDRFESESIQDAIRDGARPGRPAELEPSEFVQLASDIAEMPRSHGYNADSWTANLLQNHVSDAYDVAYSEGHARRLLRDLHPERGENP